jgi:hypothetical protein
MGKQRRLSLLGLQQQQQPQQYRLASKRQQHAQLHAG